MLFITIKDSEKILQELKDLQDQIREIAYRVRKLSFFEIEVTEKPSEIQTASQETID